MLAAQLCQLYYRRRVSHDPPNNARDAIVVHAKGHFDVERRIVCVHFGDGFGSGAHNRHNATRAEFVTAAASNCVAEDPAKW